MALTEITRNKLISLCEKALRETAAKRQAIAREYKNTPTEHRFLFWTWKTYPKYELSTSPRPDIYNGRLGLYVDAVIPRLLDAGKMSKTHVLVDEKEAKLLRHIEDSDYFWIR